MDGLSRIYPNQREEQATLGYGVVPGTPAEGYAITQANFPALIEGFIDTGISGNNNVGVLGNVTLICANGWSRPTTYQFRAAAGTQTTFGTWPAIGTKHALMIKTGLFANPGDTIADLVTFGANAGTRMGVGAGSSTAFSQLTNNTNRATLSATTLAISQKAAAVKLDQSTANGHAYGYWVGTDDTTEGPVIESTLVGDVSGNWPAFSTGASTGSITAQVTPQYYTGVWLFAFNDFPNDIVITDAIGWMADNPRQLYPGFYHRS